MAYLGIPDNQKGEFHDFLQTAAATDFWHDFHKAKSAPVLDRLGKSYNIASGLSVVNYQKRVLELRKAFAGATLYDMFKGFPTDILLLGGQPEELRKTEDGIVNMVFPYSELRQSLIEASAVESPEVIGPNQVSVGPTQAPYTITAIPAKVRGVYAPIAPIFEAASGNGCRNFILMIDASFLSIKKLRDFVSEDPSVIYNFFIIESVENEGDPATKLSGFDEASANVRVYFLRDGNYKTLYTPFTEVGQASNLFSGCTISAYRNEEGNIDADITTDSGTTTVKNIGTASEPKEAGFLAFQKLITMGFEKTEEAMAHFLLKRAGDWCQALCLLDRGRPYQVVPASDNCPMEGFPVGVDGIYRITLNELIELLGIVEMGVLSHDKILVGFLSEIGLNGFLSMKVAAPGAAAVPEDEDESSTSATWLVYIKNTLDSNPDVINTSAEIKRDSIVNEINSIVTKKGSTRETVEGAIEEQYGVMLPRCLTAIQEAHDSNDLVRFLTTLRFVSEAVSKVRAKPETSLTDIGNDLVSGAFDTLEANVKFSRVSQYESIVHSYLERVDSLENITRVLTALRDGPFLESFAYEASQIQALVNDIKTSKPLSQKDGTPFEHLRYFLENTAPAIKRAIPSLIELNEGIREYLEYPDSSVFGFKRSSLLIFKNWYEIYKETVLGIQAGGRVVEYQTDLNTKVAFPITLGNILQTRSTEDESYDLDDFMRDFIPYIDSDDLYAELYTQDDDIRGNIISEATDMYLYESNRRELTPSNLSNYIEAVFDKFASDTLDAIDKGIVFDIDIILTESKQALRPLYLENIIDMGASIVLPSGLAYTALDRCIVTNEQEFIWKNLFDLWKPETNPNSIDSMSAFTHGLVYYRFLLYNLDRFTNIINKLELTLNDKDAGLQVEPYYTEDQERTVKQIMTILNDIQGILGAGVSPTQGISDISSASFLNGDTGILDESLAAEVDSYVSYDEIVKKIAILKVIVILKYYQSNAQAILDANRELAETAPFNGMRERAEQAIAKWTPIASSRRSTLNDYQLVRLFYLVCPSLECLDELQQLLEGDGLEPYIQIAKTFQITNTEGVIPNDLTAEEVAILDENALAYGDGLFVGYLELREGHHGGRRRKTRYPTTRSKRKGKRRLTKRHRQQKHKKQQTQRNRAITRRR
jgi:hypothetical protein